MRGMPAYKDLEDMVRKAIEAEMKRMEEIIEFVSREVKESMENQSYIEPLYTEIRRENRVVYVLDVPYLRDETIYIKLEKNTLNFSCTDNRGTKYRLSLRIPNDMSQPEVKVSRVKGRVCLIVEGKASK